MKVVSINNDLPVRLRVTLESCIVLLQKASQSWQEGAERQGYQLLVEGIGQLGSLMQLVHECGGFYGWESPALQVFQAGSLTDKVQAMNELFTRLLLAMEGKDTVLASDLIQYELLDALKEFRLFSHALDRPGRQQGGVTRCTGT